MKIVACGLRMLVGLEGLQRRAEEVGGPLAV